MEKPVVEVGIIKWIKWKTSRNNVGFLKDFGFISRYYKNNKTDIYVHITSASQRIIDMADYRFGDLSKEFVVFSVGYGKVSVGEEKYEKAYSVVLLDEFIKTKSLHDLVQFLETQIQLLDSSMVNKFIYAMPQVVLNNSTLAKQILANNKSITSIFKLFPVREIANSKEKLDLVLNLFKSKYHSKKISETENKKIIGLLGYLNKEYRFNFPFDFHLLFLSTTLAELPPKNDKLRLQRQAYINEGIERCKKDGQLTSYFFANQLCPEDTLAGHIYNTAIQEYPLQIRVARKVKEIGECRDVIKLGYLHFELYRLLGNNTLSSLIREFILCDISNLEFSSRSTLQIVYHLALLDHLISTTEDISINFIYLEEFIELILRNKNTFIQTKQYIFDKNILVKKFNLVFDDKKNHHIMFRKIMSS